MKKIIGIGVDIVEIKRISLLLKRNIRFKTRIFSKKEISHCDKKNNFYSCYAKRFAAKESFAKALGIGISNGLNFNEIEVINNSKGKPTINLLGSSKKIVKKIINNKKFETKLSLSDEKKYAIAMLILST